jgi:hypothetical protein
MGTREDALEGICSYNQAGTLRTLRQYEAMTGQLPDGLHTGLDDTAASNAPMKLPPAFQKNLATDSTNGCIYSLQAPDVAALKNAGINKLAYGTGDATLTGDAALGYELVATSKKVIAVNSNWTSDNAPFTFNGKGVPALNAEGYEHIITLFVAPTTDWSAPSTGWVKGFSVKMDIPGTCPVPNDENTEFAYYVAYVGLRTKGFNISYSVAEGQTLPSTAKKWLDTAPTNADSLGLTGSSPTYTYNPTTNAITIPDPDDAGKTILVATVTLSEIKENPNSDAGEVAPSAVLVGTSCPECGITNP